jgi:hypothetical protein
MTSTLEALSPAMKLNDEGTLPLSLGRRTIPLCRTRPPMIEHGSLFDWTALWGPWRVYDRQGLSTRDILYIIRCGEFPQRRLLSDVKLSPARRS